MGEVEAERSHPHTLGRTSMLDMCVVHQYYGFSDEDIEAAIYGMQSACVFVCINLGRDSAP